MLSSADKGVQHTTSARGQRMKPILSLCLAIAASYSLAINADAQDERGDLIEKHKLALAEGFCGPEGLTAVCIGYSAQQCPDLVKPFVETCLNQPPSEKFTPEDAFQRCFWREFLKKYGKQFDWSERCIKTDPSKGPLQPLPPHLDSQYKLLNPEGSRTEEAMPRSTQEPLYPGAPPSE